MLSVSFQDPDPQLAAQVATSLVKAISNTISGRKMKRYGAPVGWNSRWRN